MVRGPVDATVDVSTVADVDERADDVGAVACDWSVLWCLLQPDPTTVSASSARSTGRDEGIGIDCRHGPTCARGMAPDGPGGAAVGCRERQLMFEPTKSQFTRLSRYTLM